METVQTSNVHRWTAHSTRTFSATNIHKAFTRQRILSKSCRNRKMRECANHEQVSTRSLRRVNQVIQHTQPTHSGFLSKGTQFRSSFQMRITFVVPKKITNNLSSTSRIHDMVINQSRWVGGSRNFDHLQINVYISLSQSRIQPLCDRLNTAAVTGMVGPHMSFWL